MTELLNGVLLLGLFAAGLRLMLLPAEKTLRGLILLLMLGLLALVAAVNWQVDAEQALGRVQAALILLAVALPGLLGLRIRQTDWLQQLVRGPEGVPRRGPGLPMARPGPNRRTWIPGAPPVSPQGDTEIPVFAEYEVERRVGVGGMGSVYLAHRRSDGQAVALKVPQERYLADEKFVKRFFREAEILSQFNHPNIVQVFNYRMGGGEYYIAMEYLQGISLEDVLESRTMTLPEAVQVFRALADALRHIHLHKVVHRDLKPSNVMLLQDAWDGSELQPGGVKLMDFGIAVGQALSRLTMTGARVGTPTYMAPEQAKGIRTDARSDLYALGLLGYEMVTGRAAFEGSYESVVHQQVFEDPKPPNQVRRGIPSRLNDLILSMIEKDPDHRPNLDEVIAALDDDILVDEAFEDPDVLMLAVDDPQGTLRLLDTSGKLRQSWGSSGAEQGQDMRLPAIPTALGRGSAGQLLVAFGQHRRLEGGMVWVLDSRGQRVRHFGSYGLGEAELLRPVGLATLGDQYYVLDGESQQVKVYGLDGSFRFRFGGLGSEEGEFRQAQSLCAGGGYLYVLDCGNHRVQRFSPQGKYVSRLAFRLERGSDDLRPLTGLTVDAGGAVYLVDAIAGKVRRVDADGAPSAPVALRREVGEGADALWLLGTGPRGQIYAVPRGGQLLRIYSPSGDLLGTRNMYTPVQALSAFRRDVDQSGPAQSSTGQSSPEEAALLPDAQSISG
ncbi:serine/threonine protein kinase [Deinococcus piscis]|uniref:Serine/threonine protein kinase n=1 Tax=Deinococcus piscis TaxID=394230 RepID=A0ABQ3K6U0_9DEIO|nr:protein kinase [Deinococcus piscis]GHG05597.1 serine/threonine protein kinase [Deinococcus piscis]